MKEIYVIGYPKSGTSWVLHLVADALDSPSYTAYGKDKSPPVVNGNYKVFHTHYSKRDVPCHIIEQAKIIYVVRDFRDALISAFFHFYPIDERLIVLDEYCNEAKKGRIFWRKFVFVLEINKLIRNWGSISYGTSWVQFFKGLLKSRWIGFKNIIKGILGKNVTRTSIGTWSNHVDYWTSLSSPNIAVIKYEDLLANTYQTLTNALSKIDIPYNVEKVRDAIDRQSFKKKKEMFKKVEDSSLKYMRKGISGGWKRFLSKRMLRKLRDKHGCTVKKMGYQIE